MDQDTLLELGQLLVDEPSQDRIIVAGESEELLRNFTGRLEGAAEKLLQVSSVGGHHERGELEDGVGDVGQGQGK